MKKIISKTKQIALSIGIAIISIPNKIFAVMNDYRAEQDLYGPPSTIIQTPGLYGPPKTETKINGFWTAFKWTIIPIVLLIGIIVYFKKSKSSVKKKILVTICAIATIAIVCYIISLIINKI